MQRWRGKSFTLDLFLLCSFGQRTAAGAVSDAEPLGFGEDFLEAPPAEFEIDRLGYTDMPQQNLLSEATRYGTGEILRHMPATYSPELECVIRQGVRQAVLHYAECVDTRSRQLQAPGHGRQGQA